MKAIHDLDDAHSVDLDLAPPPSVRRETFEDPRHTQLYTARGRIAALAAYDDSTRSGAVFSFRDATWLICGPVAREEFAEVVRYLIQATGKEIDDETRPTT